MSKKMLRAAPVLWKPYAGALWGGVLKPPRSYTPPEDQ